jgi:hypothetical protein
MDMQSKLILMGILIAPILVLAAVLGGEQGLQERYTLADAPPASNDEPEQAQDAGLVCMVLVGGTALLTGKVWIEKLRHTETGLPDRNPAESSSLSFPTSITPCD